MADTEKSGIETFIWRGQTRYRCPGHWESGAKCEYDSADYNALVMHMRSPHLRAAPTAAPAAPTAAVPDAVADTEATAPEFTGAKFAEPEE